MKGADPSCDEVRKSERANCSLLNKKHIRDFILGHPKAKARGFERVSESVYNEMQRVLEKAIEAKLHSAPHKKTLE